ncbi:hypothetical protein EGW08_004616, partial [Elysia chlorotica]
ILNKLTPEKFDKLSLELLNVGIETQVILRGIILLIFEKALEEPKYSSLYAQLCHRLCEDSPNFDPPTSSVNTFRRLLLTRCQDEFENRSHATEAFDKKDVLLTEDEQEQYHIVKKKMLGNIKFIGELGKLEMLHENILHRCIKQLLEKKKNSQLKDMSEDLECLCQIMRTIGPRIDTPKARAWMDQYFERINYFADNGDLPSRIRFMLQDVIELRNNNWKPRKIASENGPKTITQIRHDANVSNGRNNQSNQAALVHSRMNMNNIPGANLRGGMGDLFSMPVGSMGSAIGVGPGVIQMDPFTAMPQYNNGMNRNRFNGPNPGYQNNFQNNFNNKGRGKPQQDGGSPGNQRRNQGGGGPGGGGSYNNQQGFQSNNHFQQQQQQQSASRDLPPRFQRMAQHQQFQPMGGPGSGGSTNSAPLGAPNQPSPSHSPPLIGPPAVTNGNVGSGKEEVSLRPAKNFTHMFKPNTPSMLPRSAQAQHPAPRETGFAAKKSTDISEMLNPLLDKQQQQNQQQQQQPPAPKQNKEEKNKSPIKEKLTKEKMTDKVTKLLGDYYVTGHEYEAIADIKLINVPRKMIPDLVAHIMMNALEKTDTEQELAVKLIDAMKGEGIISAELFMESLKKVANQMGGLEAEVPLVKSHVARFGAMATTRGLVTLTELSEPFDGGVHYPLFLLCLQHMHKIKGESWLVDKFNNSKMDLQKMLPELDQNKERMLEILEDRGLSFMFPLLRVQSELAKQINTEPTAAALFKWVKEKVDPSLQTDPGFISILVASLLKYITSESTLRGDNIDTTVTPEKALMDREKELLEKVKGALEILLNDHVDLQMAALYAVQVFCYSHQFPKGMFLRFFVNLYDMEVIDEEVYLRWKEEVNDEYPGKGKALFQVNQWLNWLEQADDDEEESEEEDDD